MTQHRVVPHAQWLSARRELLAKEKAFTRLRDELSAARRDLPWERVETNYVFEGAAGKTSLADAFGGKSQLVVYHFMFAPDWQEGCKSCSFWADNFNGILPHLAARDVALVAISRAPVERLASFAKRLGWSFPWLSSGGTSFNADYGVSFTAAAQERGDAIYNYAPTATKMSDLPGISVFVKDETGAIFHSYSCYARGLDMVNAAYQFLDLVPKGRDEEGLPHTMSWVRLNDRY